jgi:hypothetical protein
MNAKKLSVRLVFVIASVLSTVTTLGSVVFLPEHYNQFPQSAAVRSVLIAQR